jgi:hypothetical protein
LVHDFRITGQASVNTLNLLMGLLASNVTEG